MTKEFWIEKIRADRHAFMSMPDKQQADVEIVLAAVKQDGYMLGYASKEMAGNITVVLEAVKSMGCALRYASAELLDNEEVVRAAVSCEGESLRYASDRLRGDAEIVLLAVANQFESIRYASENMVNMRVINMLVHNGEEEEVIALLANAARQQKMDREKSKLEEALGSHHMESKRAVGLKV